MPAPTTYQSLETDIRNLVDAGASADRDAARATFAQLREALSSGQVRAAEPDPSSPVGWRVNLWVKQGILLGFRFGEMVDASMDHGKLPFYDKDTLPLKKPGLAAGVRISNNNPDPQELARLLDEDHVETLRARLRNPHPVAGPTEQVQVSRPSAPPGPRSRPPSHRCAAR